MARHRIAIIIPAFNEEVTIAKVVKEATHFGTPIVVDDFSSDQTSVEATKAGAIVIKHDVNRGYDCALNSGFKHASELGFDYLITLDADGQHKPQLIRQYIDALDQGYSIVLGVRNRKQRIAEYIFGWYTALRFGVHDPLCGMKGYKRRVYEELGYFDSYESIGTELILYAISHGHRFLEVRCKVSSRQDKPRFGSSLSANRKILHSLIKGCLFSTKKLCDGK